MVREINRDEEPFHLGLHYWGTSPKQDRVPVSSRPNGSPDPDKTPLCGAPKIRGRGPDFPVDRLDCVHRRVAERHVNGAYVLRQLPFVVAPIMVAVTKGCRLTKLRAICEGDRP